MQEIFHALIYVIFVVVTVIVAMFVALSAVNLDSTLKKQIKKRFVISQLCATPILFAIVYTKSVIPQKQTYIVDIITIAVGAIAMFFVAKHFKK